MHETVPWARVFQCFWCGRGGGCFPAPPLGGFRPHVRALARTSARTQRTKVCVVFRRPTGVRAISAFTWSSVFDQISGECPNVCPKSAGKWGSPQWWAERCRGSCFLQGKLGLVPDAGRAVRSRVFGPGPATKCCPDPAPAQRTKGTPAIRRAPVCRGLALANCPRGLFSPRRPKPAGKRSIGSSIRPRPHKGVQ